ncbi:uncharacterized protein Bfra_007233 [Botrytis fragariae]|uniref:Uncharacterized protein n=1 Tax=Botrytis fragariae TaxID=1964551 RepID=A0A8H6EDE4_9HELO|nr:uncharacterized protein Bfra_007233 [Botrytis fragariae]KAF5868038.1 hypothetical protein Bfra_007233 [Botrytis fragariae]
MHHNTKQGLIFLAFLIACGGGIAAFILLRNSHNQHPHSGKREMGGMDPNKIYARSLPTSGVTTSRYVGLEKSESPQVHPSYTHHSTQSQHRNRHRSFTPEREIGNNGSQFVTIPTTTATSANVQPLSTAATSSASSIDIYSSFTVEPLSTLAAAVGFQTSAASSSDPISDTSLISTTPTSLQPLATTGSGHSHLLVAGLRVNIQ